MRNKGAEQRGLALAYEDGLPQDQIAKFDADEAELHWLSDPWLETPLGRLRNRVCLHLLLGRFRNLSGWEAYGYAQGMAEQGALAYSAYMESAKRSQKITIEDADGNVKEISYAEAENWSQKRMLGWQLLVSSI